MATGGLWGQPHEDGEHGFVRIDSSRTVMVPLRKVRWDAASRKTIVDAEGRVVERTVRVALADGRIRPIRVSISATYSAEKYTFSVTMKGDRTTVVTLTVEDGKGTGNTFATVEAIVNDRKVHGLVRGERLPWSGARPS